MPETAPPSDTVTCAGCGTKAIATPVTWMSDRDSRRGTVHYCPDCQRTHLRAIEAKLPEQWW